MAKLKNVVNNLSSRDFEAIFEQLMESSAEKSALLLKLLRQEDKTDQNIMDDLEVNSNAYYTLRSRLNQKIESYLLDQMENPRTDLLKKVSNVNEILFTRRRAIVIATIKKLEKELLDYDLSNELTIIYKALKKLHIHSPDYFTYSQLYNRHVAYMLATDKVEDQLAQYFKKYGEFLLMGHQGNLHEMQLLVQDVNNTTNLYKSHRMYVYKSLLGIFHRLYVEDIESDDVAEEPIEDILNNLVNIFDTYYLDTVYHNLKAIFNFLKLEYYNYFNLYRKAEIYFEDVNENCIALLANYDQYTFPAQFLFSKLKRYLRQGLEKQLYKEDKTLFAEYEPNKDNVPLLVVYHTYRALGCYYAGKYEEASRWLYMLLNEVSLKNYPYSLLEVKLLLALQYCHLQDYELFNQSVNSIQRQIRLVDKVNCDHAQIFIKIIKTAISEKKDKPSKMRNLVERMNATPDPKFSPIKYLRYDDAFILNLINTAMPN